MSRRSPEGASSGFTVIELLVVIGVAVAIMGMSISAFQYARRKAQLDTTKSLVMAVATAIEEYGQRLRPVYGPDPADMTRRKLVANLPMWDVDKNSIIDDSKGVDRDAALKALLSKISGSTLADLDMQGYSGFVGGSFAKVPGEAFDKATGRIVDAWGTPLRFKTALTAGSTSTSGEAGIFAGSWFGVWSCGPNAADDKGDGDDICNWK